MPFTVLRPFCFPPRRRPAQTSGRSRCVVAVGSFQRGLKSAPASCPTSTANRPPNCSTLLATQRKPRNGNDATLGPAGSPIPSQRTAAAWGRTTAGCGQPVLPFLLQHSAYAACSSTGTAMGTTSPGALSPPETPAFGYRRSASRTCLPALTRRAIACPIEPAPMTTITLVIANAFLELNRFVPAHRPRASGARSASAPLSRGSVQPGC